MVEMDDAQLAAVLLAIDPAGLKGAIVIGEMRSACETWIDMYLSLAPRGAPVRRIPANISEDRLVGGLDFAATIAAGHGIAERGVLAAADGGVVITASDTTRTITWSLITRALDSGCVTLERDGLAQRDDARFAVLVPCTVGDDAVPGAISDRVTFLVDVRRSGNSAITPRLALSSDLTTPDAPWRQDCLENINSARRKLAEVHLSDKMLTALCDGANALGVTSARVAMSALAAARAHAALSDREIVNEDDLACAARLVLAPRATRIPEEMQEESNVEQAEAAGSESAMQDQHSGTVEAESSRDEPGDDMSIKEMSEVVVRAATSAIPPGLIAASAALSARGTGANGRAGAERVGVRGRQIGTRRGRPTGGARLDLVATLRAAAPMQRVRRSTRVVESSRLVELRRDDFRVRRCVTPSQTTTIFIVDASGSAALNRLAEAKGAVELMLAEGYARRERVAVIAFRGTVASLVLPPTHALARARRAIAGMPAGGGTPLASALDLTIEVVMNARRDAAQVVTVLLTDGRANVGRDGNGGRARAQAEALDAARALSALGADSIFIDTAARPEPFAKQLATALNARYVPLPVLTAAGVRDVSHVVRGEHALAGAHG